MAVYSYLITSIQRRAALMITGAMKTTATDMVEVMANLIPFNLLVDKYRQCAAIRLAMLLPMHPLHKPIKNAASKLVKHHATPLHDLMHRFNIHPQSIETIKAVCFDTEWKPKIKTKTARNTDKAIEDANNDNPDVKVFTDGSGMEEKIGAAAVLYRNGRVKTMLRYQLGSQRHHMVYEGEGVGVVLGTKLISNEWGIWSAIIYTDNQAAITATQLTKPNPGHHIFDTLHDNIEAL
jgi:hypothetical protein